MILIPGLIVSTAKQNELYNSASLSSPVTKKAYFYYIVYDPLILIL